MTTLDLDFDPLDLCEAERFANGYPHDIWRALRAHDPVHWCEPDGYRPFWAVTKHEDIKSISAQPERFSSTPRLTFIPIEMEQQALAMFPDAADQGGMPLRMLVTMDPPEHRTYRHLTAPYFLPRVLRNLEDRVVDITRALLDQFAGDDRELDFVTDVASWHPLRMICEIIGVAADDEQLILRLTNELFGGLDPELAPQEQGTVLLEMFRYFHDLVEHKRAAPRDDLGSVLSNATIDGELLPHIELMSYLVLIATAGHDTTRNAISAGMHVLISNHDQWARLREEPELAATAADEIVRWASPVIHFIRTANEDCEIRGQSIRAGDHLALFYPSANRDEEVFDEPFAFRVDRQPNPHVGFGFGEHYCLGATLARMEIRVLLEHLIPRLESVELAGEPAYTHASFVGGFKHLPIRWSLR
ncbi:MAG: cytochrome P450 [Acidimicrobiales bacterium]